MNSTSGSYFSDSTIKNGSNSDDHHLVFISVSYENLKNSYKKLLGSRRNDFFKINSYKCQECNIFFQRPMFNNGQH